MCLTAVQSSFSDTFGNLCSHVTDVMNPTLMFQYSQAPSTMVDMQECEQAKELGAINSTLRWDRDPPPPLNWPAYFQSRKRFLRKTFLFFQAAARSVLEADQTLQFLQVCAEVQQYSCSPGITGKTENEACVVYKHFSVEFSGSLRSD